MSQEYYVMSEFHVDQLSIYYPEMVSFVRPLSFVHDSLHFKIFKIDYELQINQLYFRRWRSLRVCQC